MYGGAPSDTVSAKEQEVSLAEYARAASSPDGDQQSSAGSQSGPRGVSSSGAWSGSFINSGPRGDSDAGGTWPDGGRVGPSSYPKPVAATPTVASDADKALGTSPSQRNPTSSSFPSSLPGAQQQSLQWDGLPPPSPPPPAVSSSSALQPGISRQTSPIGIPAGFGPMAGTVMSTVWGQDQPPPAQLLALPTTASNYRTPMGYNYTPNYPNAPKMYQPSYGSPYNQTARGLGAGAGAGVQPHHPLDRLLPWDRSPAVLPETAAMMEDEEAAAALLMDTISKLSPGPRPFAPPPPQPPPHLTPTRRPATARKPRTPEWDPRTSTRPRRSPQPKSSIPPTPLAQKLQAEPSELGMMYYAHLQEVAAGKARKMLNLSRTPPRRQSPLRQPPSAQSSEVHLAMPPATPRTPWGPTPTTFTDSSVPASILRAAATAAQRAVSGPSRPVQPAAMVKAAAEMPGPRPATALSARRASASSADGWSNAGIPGRQKSLLSVQPTRPPPKLRLSRQAPAPTAAPTPQPTPPRNELVYRVNLPPELTTPRKTFQTDRLRSPRNGGVTPEADRETIDMFYGKVGAWGSLGRVVKAWRAVALAWGEKRRIREYVYKWKRLRRLAAAFYPLMDAARASAMRAKITCSMAAQHRRERYKRAILKVGPCNNLSCFYFLLQCMSDKAPCFPVTKNVIPPSLDCLDLWSSRDVICGCLHHFIWLRLYSIKCFRTIER